MCLFKEDGEDFFSWRLIFSIPIAINLISGSLFIAVGSADLQTWAYKEKITQSRPNNESIDLEKDLFNSNDESIPFNSENFKNKANKIF